MVTTTSAGSGGGGASGDGKLRLSRSLLGDIKSSVVVAAAPSDGRIESSKLKLLATNESANWQSFDGSLSLVSGPPASIRSASFGTSGLGKSAKPDDGD
jgi:hypothetical protein